MADSSISRRPARGHQANRSDRVGAGPVEQPAPQAAAQATSAVDILHFGSTDLVACAGPCVITVSVEITMPGIEAITRALARLQRRYGSVCAFSVTDRQSSGGIDPACRQGLIELTRKYTHVLSGTATVLEGAGFRATALRSLVTAIHLASSSTHPAKVFAAVQPALEWLASTQPAGALDIAGMAQSITTFRAQLKEKASKRDP
jgi:hypothetical protein